MSTEVVNVVVWDATGILLFIAWLLLPPVYVIVLGRRYVCRCEEAAQTAVWAREELRQALEDLSACWRREEQPEGSFEVDPPAVPPARQYRADDTQEFGTVLTPDDGTGKHRLDRSPLACSAFRG